MIILEIMGELPKTPNELSGMHWGKVSKLRARWRYQTAYLAKVEAKAQKAKVPFKKVELTLIRGSSRKTDLDNIIASFKPLIDGLKDAGIITDDNPSVVVKIHAHWEQTKRDATFVRLVIDPIET